MITPRFSLSQDTETITINIRAPYCNLKELDVCVDKNEFLFVCYPYYLRLNLPGNILENNATKSSFDSNSGEFTFTYQKENKEEFPNLDFITTFLHPKTIEVYEGGRKIELLTSERTQLESDIDTSNKYGFALRGGYSFEMVNGEFTDVFSIDPFNIEFKNRREQRISNEKAKFDANHYIADLMDDSEIIEVCKLTSPWKNLEKENVVFTEKELDFLKDLSNINYSLTSEQVNYSYNSLIEILFAYCYDRRTTFYEGTCESGWTISNISASLNCFDSFADPKEAIICAYRRSLIYPLYRSFKLCEKVFEDLKSLLKLNNKYIIKCLIDMHNIFLHGGSNRYILNKLFVDDYNVYMMKNNTNLWMETLETVSKMEISKSELGLDLFNIEKSIADGELSAAIAKLSVDNNSDDSDDISDSSNTESDSSDIESDSSSIESEPSKNCSAKNKTVPCVSEKKSLQL